MNFDLMLVNGFVASSQGVTRSDVGIRERRIEAVGDLGGFSAAETRDLGGLTIMPGVIDTQVHFREPGLEHKEDLESGSRAAVVGGVTTVFEMPNTVPPTTTSEALADKLARARGRMWTNYAFFVGATAENAEQLDRLEMMPGTPGVKVFMGSSTGSLLVSEESDLERVYRHGKRPSPVHAEDEGRLRERKALISDQPHVREHPFLRDPESAVLATRRVIRLCEETGRPIHILHVSTSQEVDLIAEAKARGLPITAEVTPQHLFFAAPECYERLGTRVQMNTPIRDESHRQALREGLRRGVFDIVGSDHAPHTAEEKARPYPSSPSGMPGVQTILPVTLDFVHRGMLGLEDLVRLVAENPAKLYGVRGKGQVAPGYDADLTIVDLEGRLEVTPDWLQSKCGWSPYEGMTLIGSPEHVIVGGRVAVWERRLVGSPNGTMVEFDWK